MDEAIRDLCARLAAHAEQLAQEGTPSPEAHALLESVSGYLIAVAGACESYTLTSVTIMVNEHSDSLERGGAHAGELDDDGEGW